MSLTEHSIRFGAGPVPLDIDSSCALSNSLGSARRIRNSEWELGCDWLLKGGSIRDAILVLSFDPEVVFLVWFQSNDLIM